MKSRISIKTSVTPLAATCKATPAPVIPTDNQKYPGAILIFLIDTTCFLWKIYITSSNEPIYSPSISCYCHRFPQRFCVAFTAFFQPFVELFLALIVHGWLKVSSLLSCLWASTRPNPSSALPNQLGRLHLGQLLPSFSTGNIDLKMSALELHESCSWLHHHLPSRLDNACASTCMVSMMSRTW